MADPVLALEVLFEDVKARFADEASTVAVVFGWREPGKQINQGLGRANRIAFVPGVDGKAGDYEPARAPGRNPRPLRTLMEQCTVYCWAWDGSDKKLVRDDMTQWRAARLLHDAAVRACELAMRKTAIKNLTAEPFSDPEWVMPNAEHGFGAEIKFVLTLESMIPDEPFDETDQLQAGIGNFLNEEQDGTDLIGPEEEA